VLKTTRVGNEDRLKPKITGDYTRRSGRSDRGSLPHDNNRARSMVDHLLTHRTQQEAAEPSTPATSDHDHVCVLGFFE
jgi:hypothetical protein